MPSWLNWSGSDNSEDGWAGGYHSNSWYGNRWASSWSSQQWQIRPSIWDSVRQDDASELQLQLQDQQHLVHEQNERGWTPLHVAAMLNSAAAAKVLISFGADVHCRSGYLTPTALHLAAWHGHLNIMEVLLQHGARCDAVNGLGEFPLEKATQRDKKAAAEMLVEAGSPPVRPGRDICPHPS
eukprot:gnl/MRDRNA2_/MRDRNA2_75876_c0_seq2.p1 gnl/MRDRNA2_/MRDRNA2_75876_c0~~gnl/MRDRNA2_/MRDRNA2_75876_c0_seq2.p1  ORF type:complete len:182 (+),score=28.70 gnl/MRDRNA2_/MRDRNA2_75876_c0_seq2:110-655(+)